MNLQIGFESIALMEMSRSTCYGKNTDPAHSNLLDSRGISFAASCVFGYHAGTLQWLSRACQFKDRSLAGGDGKRKGKGKKRQRASHRPRIGRVLNDDQLAGQRFYSGCRRVW
jgi:hypothetical protein